MVRKTIPLPPFRAIREKTSKSITIASKMFNECKENQADQHGERKGPI